MLKRILNAKTGLRFAVTGVISLFLSFLFMPGNVRHHTEVSPLPYLMFVSGSTLIVIGLLLFIGSFVFKKFSD